jgi:hypothetical protein
MNTVEALTPNSFVAPVGVRPTLIVMVPFTTLVTS